MTVRMLQKPDIQKCVHICDLNHGHKYHDQINRELHRSFDKAFFVKPTFYVMEDGDIVAFAGYAPCGFNNNIYGLFWVNVHPAHRGNKYGRRVVKQIVHSVSKKLIDTNRAGCLLLTCDLPLEPFYQKFGFKRIEQTANDLVMCLKVNQPVPVKASQLYAPAYDTFSSVKKHGPVNIHYPRYKFDLNENECFYCQDELNAEVRTKDHIYPKAAGGRRVDGNWVYACQRCNGLKEDYTISQFLQHIKLWILKKTDKPGSEVEIGYLKKVMEKVIFMISKLYPDGDKN
jgi:predicted GNAT family N-acyltransferase